MANEIKVTNSVSLTKGGIKKRGISSNNISIDQTGNGYAGNTIDVVNVETALDVSDLSTPGRFQIVNQEDAGGNNLFVKVSDGAAGYRTICELWPGEPMTGRWSQTIYVSANTTGAAVLCEYFVAEE